MIKRFLAAVATSVLLCGLCGCQQKEGNEVSSQRWTSTADASLNKGELKSEAIDAEGEASNNGYNGEPHEHQWVSIYGDVPVEPYEEVEAVIEGITYDKTYYICTSCHVNLTEAGLDEEGIQEHVEEHKKEGIDALILPTLHEKVTTYTEMVPKTHRVCIGQRCTVCNEKKYTEEYLKSISGD